MKVPSGACDCHVHVFGPAARYPFAADRAYTPADASVEELLALQQRLGFERVVIVQPSVYGSDNSCTLDAVRRLGTRARAVAVIDSRTSLAGMHEAGVRGVRVNLHTGGIDDAEAARRVLDETAARVASLGWHVQVFTNLKLLRRIGRLPAALVIDHFGLPRDQADIDHLVHLLRTSDVFVKLSGTHRLPMDPGPVVRTLVDANPDRCLWGSDWPHPFTGGKRDPRQVQPFDKIDDAASLAKLHDWVSDGRLFRKILVDNPARLYDF